MVTSSRPTEVVDRCSDCRPFACERPVPTGSSSSEPPHSDSHTSHVTDERTDEHEPVDEVRFFSRRPHGGSRTHRVADEDGGLAQVLEQRERIASRGDVVVLREGSVAVTMATQVHRRDPEVGMDERPSDMPV